MRSLSPPRRSLSTVPAPVLFIASAISQYLGAALAVLLFAAVPAAGVAWLRIVASALLLLAWRRPWRTLDQGRLGLVAAFGVALAGMNLAFYLAIERLPLGTAVAVEFLGPITVAALGTRTRRDLGALALALAGVGLLFEVERSGSPAGIAFALLAAALWAAYIVLGARVATGGSGLDGLAAGMAAGALVVAPLAGPAALPALADPTLLGLCLGIGVLSSVVPYGLDQLVLARISRGRYALLLALLPATAALVGAAVLRQVPGPSEALGITLVAAAVAVRSPR